LIAFGKEEQWNPVVFDLLFMEYGRESRADLITLLYFTHARSTIGVAELPLNIPVEIEMVN
jgi:hypothetical protein